MTARLVTCGVIMLQLKAQGGERFFQSPAFERHLIAVAASETYVSRKNIISRHSSTSTIIILSAIW
jgi:hypothetical protein